MCLNLQCNNVARQGEEKCCPYYWTFKVRNQKLSTESKVEPITNNDQNSLCSGKNKMAAINRGARAAAFDWNDFFCFFMYLNTELLRLCHLNLIAARFVGGCAFSNRANKDAIAFVVFCLLALSFSSLSHRIGLSLKWATSIRALLLFQEIKPRSSGFLAENHPQPILIQQCSASKHSGLYKNHAPCGQSVHTKGHVAATHPWNIFPQHFHVGANAVILSLLHVTSVCITRVFVAATCCCNMSLQHDPLCLATLNLVNSKLAKTVA